MTGLQYSPLQKPDILAVMECEGITLRKTGRTYRGKCPNHDGKSSGSLAVYPDSQSWYCWGCAEGGDVISFIEKCHNASFKDSLSILGIRKGQPVAIDPARERRLVLLKAFERWRRAYYLELCDAAIEIRDLQAKGKDRKPLPEELAFWLAEKISELPEIEYKLDILTGNDDEMKLQLFEEY